MADVNETLSEEDQFAAAQLPGHEDPVEVADQAATLPLEPAAVTETPAEIAQAEEFFPGYAALPEESQKLVRERMEAADKAQELSARLYKAENERSAMAGKIAPIQREYAAARQRLKEFEEAQNNVRKSSAKDILAKYRAEYPDEAAALDAVNSAHEEFAERTARENAELREHLKALDGKFNSQFQEFESNKAFEQNRNTLAQEHPDFAEIDSSPQWKAWLGAIDEVKLQVFMENRHDPKVVASTLTDFKRDRYIAELLDAQGSTAPPNTPAPKPLARSVADPNPTIRRSTALPRSNSTEGLDGADKFSADLEIARAAGYPV